MEGVGALVKPHGGDAEGARVEVCFEGAQGGAGGEGISREADGPAGRQAPVEHGAVQLDRGLVVAALAGATVIAWAYFTQMAGDMHAMAMPAMTSSTDTARTA